MKKKMTITEPFMLFGFAMLLLFGLPKCGGDSPRSETKSPLQSVGSVCDAAQPTLMLTVVEENGEQPYTFYALYTADGWQMSDKNMVTATIEQLLNGVKMIEDEWGQDILEAKYQLLNGSTCR